MVSNKIFYHELENTRGYYLLLSLFAVMFLIGVAATWYMEHNGHWVTGMNNQIVWGFPHVFAIFMIVAASGALNVASIGTVFGEQEYKPFGRLSAVLSIALLAGGLMILVLDLGRPDRLMVTLTNANFKSIFAWNIYLYSGFFAMVITYLWFMMDSKMHRFYRPLGISAFIWRLILTTGTGSIFAFLVAREAYTAIMAPMFIIMSFAYGLATFLMVIQWNCILTDWKLGGQVASRLKNLLATFVAAVFYFTVIYHLTNMYITGHHELERFILLDGGHITTLFWVGQILMGNIIPLIILFRMDMHTSNRLLMGFASSLIVMGGVIQVYIIVIGGQMFPLKIFPGYEAASGFGDGVITSYVPTLAEVALGLGGFALFLLITTVSMRLFRLMPESFDDDEENI